MVKFYPSIPPDLREWILAQPLFFVASAPLVGAHINVSPKGHPSRTFAVLDPNQVAYLDATGSGVETISHIYENGRVTVMFCSFGKSPKIARLFCKGRVVERGDSAFEPWVEKMKAAGVELETSKEGSEGPGKQGARAVIVLDVFKVQTSCGFGVPLLQELSSSSKPSEPEVHPASGIVINVQDPEFCTAPGARKSWEDRSTMPKWAAHMSEKDALDEYRRKANYRSLDGCPGLKAARRDNRQWLWLEDLRVWTRRTIIGQWQSFLLGLITALIAMILLTATGTLRLDART